jgi:hypothetical protein
MCRGLHRCVRRSPSPPLAARRMELAVNFDERRTFVDDDLGLCSHVAAADLVVYAPPSHVALESDALKRHTCPGSERPSNKQLDPPTANLYLDRSSITWRHPALFYPRTCDRGEGGGSRRRRQIHPFCM